MSRLFNSPPIYIAHNAAWLTEDREKTASQNDDSLPEGFRDNNTRVRMMRYPSPPTKSPDMQLHCINKNAMKRAVLQSAPV